MKHLVGLAILLAAVGGCRKDPNETKLQFMPDMADGPTVVAQRDFLDPPDHSVAVDAIIYPEDHAVAEEEFRNPYPATPENVVQGEKYYKIYCAICHGADGKGEGTLTDAYPKAAVPDLTRPDLLARKDGFFFMMISKGRGIMPGYGHATTRSERWLITHYLRTLQENKQD